MHAAQPRSELTLAMNIIGWGPEGHINIGISHSGSREKYRGETRNTVL